MSIFNDDSMASLEELAIKYSCDKYYAHSYIPAYEALLKGRTINRMLEIGIGYEGLMTPFVPRYVVASSLKMWREYLPLAHIESFDIRQDAVDAAKEEFDTYSRVSLFTLDQSSITDLWLAADGGPFDLIIDDGSHEPEHQILSAAVLVPHLGVGGVYVIEDVREPFKVASALGGEIHKFEKRPDDCLVVVRR